MKHYMWGFAIWLCGVLAGASGFVLQGSEKDLAIAECNKSLALCQRDQDNTWKIVEGQRLCEADACVDVFKKWEAHRQYPCELHQTARRECELALERKCSHAAGRVSDCWLDLGEMESQLVKERKKLEACQNGEAQ